MNRYPKLVARIERSEMRVGRSRISLRSIRATIVVAAACGAAIALAQPAPTPPQPKQPPQQQQPQQKLTIGFVEIDGDPRYEPIQGSDRIVLKTRAHPFTGAAVGIDEAAALARVLKTDFALERITVKCPEEVAPAVKQAISRDIHFFLVDAPAEAFKPLADAIHDTDALAFNISADDDSLRRNLCSADVVHTFPSLAMRMDGLVQYLVSRKWRDYLVLEGPAKPDAAAAKAFEASAKKFGARIVAHQNF